MTSLLEYLYSIQKPNLPRRDIIIFCSWTTFTFGLGLTVGWILFRLLGL